MKSRLMLFVAVILSVSLLSFMLMFQVRYDEVAVLTTLGAADEGSVKTPRPWPYLRLPPPMQGVYKFPTRVQILEDQLEEMQTADGFAVIPRTYLAWRISDPLSFYNRVKTVEEAQKKVLPMVRELRKIISKYRFDELVNTDMNKLKLAQAEEQALAAINAQLEAQNFGMKVEHFGIRRMVLPEQVTTKVFERMRQTRQTLAQNARSEGEFQALTIKSEAQSIQRIILAFAENRAQAIRTQGLMEAAEYYKAFKEDEQLAIFLRRIDTLKKILPHNSTFVLSAEQLGVENMLTPGKTEK